MISGFYAHSILLIRQTIGRRQLLVAAGTLIEMSKANSSNCKESAHNADTWVVSLGQKDPLEKGMATHSRMPEESHG